MTVSAPIVPVPHQVGVPHYLANQLVNYLLSKPSLMEGATFFSKMIYKINHSTGQSE